MNSNNIIHKHLPQIQQLMRHYGVQRAFAFGSAVKDTMHAESDVDFIVKFSNDLDFVAYSDNYFSLANDLEKLLNREVELVAEETICNPYLMQSINSHKVQVL